MSDYNPRRRRNLYTPYSSKGYKLSRSKIALFMECPRCFYLDRRCGVGRPPTPPFNLNLAVDALLKKEFDFYRAKQAIHPLVSEYGISALPFAHPDLESWRENFVGIQYLDPDTNFTITGAVDDVWVSPSQELIIVDYKATSRDGKINIDHVWYEGYKRQMEVYQWLFLKNGFTVSPTSYLLFCNATKDRAQFDGRLEFVMTLHEYKGDYSWVDDTLMDIYECLNETKAPKERSSCDYCAYRNAASDADNFSDTLF